MSVKEYNQGDIIKDGGKYYIVVKYKGKFVCGDIDYLTRLKDYDVTEKCDIANSLSELYEICRSDSDRLATTVESKHSKCLKDFKPGEISHDSFLNGCILWQKPKGKEVWVTLNGLRKYDLNELLHTKYNYQKKNINKIPYQELPVRELIALAE